jgi:hypothetical protein
MQNPTQQPPPPPVEKEAPKEKTQGERIAESLMEHELQGPDFLTYVARPINVENIKTWSDLSPDGGAGTAIIVAGAMVYENHFTRDTIRLYRKHYPEALIILSTWDDEDADYLDAIRDDKTLVAVGERAKGGAGGRVRAQVFAALQTSEERDITHALRTSTLHRLYAPNLIEYFKSLQRAFPLSADHSQKQRIITSNHVAAKYIPYYVNTTVMFGHMHDMLNYWVAPEGGHPLLPAVDYTARIMERSKIDPASYFTRNYLQSIGVKFNPESLRDSWRILAEQFCFVDCQTMDIFWSGSNRWWDERMPLQQYAMRASQRWTFQSWLTLCMNPDRAKLAPEYIVNELFPTAIIREAHE